MDKGGILQLDKISNFFNSMNQDEVIKYFKEHQNIKKKQDIIDELKAKGINEDSIEEAIKFAYMNPMHSKPQTKGEGLSWMMFIVSLIISVMIVGIPTGFLYLFLLIIFAGWLTVPVFFSKESSIGVRIAMWGAWVVVQWFIFYFYIQLPEGIL